VAGEVKGQPAAVGHSGASMCPGCGEGHRMCGGRLTHAGGPGERARSAFLVCLEKVSGSEVMVIYLEEAVVRQRQTHGGRLTRDTLLEAVTEGALLRLRPKVMTVSTVVASLLPIMWSHSTGAEVMKALATPVLGGMVSSLAHVLLVTPVIFSWLRERELRHEAARETVESDRALAERPAFGSADGHGVPTTERRNDRCNA